MRTVRTITIEREGRDKGKTFVITEMLAIPGEKWAAKVLAALLKAGMPIPQQDAEGGMQDLAEAMQLIPPELGARAALALQDPSLEEWWDCVKYQHAPNLPPQTIIHGEGCQIEEMSTITQLRMAVLYLHLDFFSPEKGSTSEQPSPATIPTGSRPTRISRHR